MNDIESAKAAREARSSAGNWVSSSHTTAELAERAIRLYLATHSGGEHHEDKAKKDEHEEE